MVEAFINFLTHFINVTHCVCLCSDGVPSSQNPTVAIESWINHNKVEREEFSCILQENLKVTLLSVTLRHIEENAQFFCLL